MKSYIVTVTYKPETCSYRNGTLQVDAANARDAKEKVRDEIKRGGHDRHDPKFLLEASLEYPE